jgi:hypothetical protein
MFNHTPFLRTAAHMTLAASMLMAGCSTPPTDLDVTLKHTSVGGRFVVALQPPSQGPTIGQIHSWTIHVSTPDGAPVSQARFTVDGGMPQHGHGLPTRPRVTKEIAPGTYLLEGMKFSMTGWWDLRLDIEAASARDKAVFNVVMTDSGLRR